MVRWGDPLSSFLFCSAKDGLSRGIANLVAANQINLIKAAQNCFVPLHTLYHDDIMIFCRGDTKSLHVIDNLLKGYASCSGQFCNNSKSFIYAGGMSIIRHKRMADLLGFKTASPPFIYLGAPIFIGRPKNIHFQHIADKIRIKLAAWKATLLSTAGRAQPVKYVVLSITVHYIRIYN